MRISLFFIPFFLIASCSEGDTNTNQKLASINDVEQSQKIEVSKLTDTEVKAYEALALDFAKKGRAALNVQDLTTARAAYIECLRLRKLVLDADPDDRWKRSFYAIAIGNFANISIAEKDYLAAISHFEAGQKLKKSIAIDYPEDGMAQRSHLETFFPLIDVNGKIGNIDRVHFLYKEANDLITPLLVSAKTNPDYTHHFSDLHYDRFSLEKVYFRHVLVAGELELAEKALSKMLESTDVMVMLAPNPDIGKSFQKQTEGFWLALQKASINKLQ